MTTEQERVRSLDDPDLMVQTPATIYDAVPPLEPRTEREADVVGRHVDPASSAWPTG